MNAELESVRKAVVVAESTQYPGIYLRGVRENHERRRRGRDLNYAHSE
jgi:hypothetical protein